MERSKRADAVRTECVIATACLATGLLLASSCGPAMIGLGLSQMGNSGGGGTTPPAFSAEWTIPGDGAFDVEPGAVIRVSFSKEIDPRSANVATVEVRSDNAIVALSIEPNGSELVLHPRERLALAERYRVNVAGVTSGSGERLENPISFAFTTRDGRWGPPTQISSDGVDARAGGLASFGDGNTIAVWAEGSTSGLYLASSELDRQRAVWDRPTRVSGRSFVWGDVSPRTDGADQAFLCFSGVVDKSVRTFASRYDRARRSWTSETIDRDERARDATIDPALSVNRRGDAIAVWIETQISKSVPGELWASSYHEGTWSPSVPIVNSSTLDASDPKVVIDDVGNAIAVWAQSVYPAAAEDLWAATYRPQAGWGKPIRLHEASPGQPLRGPALGIDRANKVVVIWGGAGLFAAEFTIASGWSEPTRIEDETTHPTDQMAIGFADDRSAIAVWVREDRQLEEVLYTKFEPGRGWQASRVVSPPTPNEISDLRLAVGPRGNAIAGWSEVGIAVRGSSVARFVPRDGWSAARFLGDRTAVHALSIDRLGRGLMLMGQVVGPRVPLFSMRFE